MYHLDMKGLQEMVSEKSFSPYLTKYRKYPISSYEKENVSFIRKNGVMRRRLTML